MVRALLTPDLKWITLEGTPFEIENIRLDFSKKIDRWYIIKSKNPDACVDENFMMQTCPTIGMIPVGLWVELVNTCNKFGISIEFQNDFNSMVTDSSFSDDAFKKYVDKLFSNSSIKPFDYQVDAAINVLRYRNCCIEISTSGGKTLSSYIIFRYLIDVVGLKHILFVTPKTVLTTQSAEKYIEYDEKNGILTDWTYSEVHGKAKKKDVYNETIVFGNYQSLVNKKRDFFEKFDAVIMDECHHGQSKSCRKILVSCCNARYKIGMSGTFPSSDGDDAYSNFVLQSFIGPVVFRYSSYRLINEQKAATPVYVTSIIMRYLDDVELARLYKLRSEKDKDDPTAGTKILDEEKRVARASYERFKYITDMVSKTTKNTLVVFSDIQTEYGRRIYSRVKESTPKNVYYIDGDTPIQARETIKNCMEDDMDGNTVIVASMGCFSEGIDICNLWNIFLVEDTKSDNILAQLLGRGMRRFKGKDKTIMIDFSDDFRFGSGYFSENYLYKHHLERCEIYRRRGFPHSMLEVSLK